jgi:hypothetical protein
VYAALIESRTTPRWRSETDRIVTNALIGALETEPGYTGALNLPDQAHGESATIAVFQTEAQARRALAEHAPRFLSIGRRLIAASVQQRH